MSAPKYCYSLDTERYYGSDASIEDAFNEALACEPEAGKIFIGECMPYEPKISVLALESILENLREEAYEHAGEAAEDFLCTLPDSVEELLAQKLTETLHAFLRETDLYPKFYGATQVACFVKDEITSWKRE